MVDCNRCKHYYITWDPRHPYGCRLFGFKTSQIPARVVAQNAGGQTCAGFTEKNRPESSDDSWGEVSSGYGTMKK